MNSSHPSLSNQFDVVNKLSPYFRHVTVLTGSSITSSTQKNLNVLDFEWNKNKRVLSLIRFLKKFMELTVKNSYEVVFCHMNPRYSLIISPITKIFRKKHFLWYAHTSNPISLRICNKFIDGVITSTPGSCPIKNSQVFSIGQCIDQEMFPPLNSSQKNITRFIHIGRFDPSKNIDKIIDTIVNFKKEYPEITLTILGTPSKTESEKIAKYLKQTYFNEIQSGLLQFLPSVQRSKISATLENYDCFIHSFYGSLDKSILEATFSFKPVVTINQEYLKEFGSWSKIDNCTLGDELLALLNAPKIELNTELNVRLTKARERHSMKIWIRALVNILNS